MTGSAFGGGVNIAVKIPRADDDATVAFYRDTLGLPLEEGDAAVRPTPTAERDRETAASPRRGT